MERGNLIHNKNQTVQWKKKTEKKRNNIHKHELWCTLESSALNTSWCVVFFPLFILNPDFEFSLTISHSLKNTQCLSLSHLRYHTCSCPYMVCAYVRSSPQGTGKAKTLAHWKHFTIIRNSQVVSIMYIVHYRNMPILVIVYRKNANKWKLMYRECQSRKLSPVYFLFLVIVLSRTPTTFG